MTDPTTMDDLVEDQSVSENPGSGAATNLEEAFDDEVLRALNSLSDDARICLMLRIVEKLTYQEISAYMKIPEGTAMSMVHRARTSLRNLLATHEFATRKGEQQNE